MAKTATGQTLRGTLTGDTLTEFSSESLLTIAIISAGFTGLASVVAAVGAAIAAVISARNGKKLEEVHQATNGMSAALVKETGDRMYAKGVLKGKNGIKPQAVKKKRRLR